jgi:N-glycosylase/DNA lyase
MTQSATIYSKVGSLRVELPSPGDDVLSGVRWGAVDAFPTPAYWVYQVVYRRVSGGPPMYKLGRTLAEEVGACLLGGHGIPAAVGLAAFEKLRFAGAFSDSPPSQEQLLEWLTQPVVVNGKEVRYRFAAQKSRYLAEALGAIDAAPVGTSGLALRDWLRELPGIGYKTASWVARNWLNADDVAILDIHILRFGQAIGLFPTSLTVERHYLELERLFLELCRGMDVRPSELDAVIWHEMATSPLTVRNLMSELKSVPAKPPASRRPAKIDSQLLLPV